MDRRAETSELLWRGTSGLLIYACGGHAKVVADAAAAAGLEVAGFGDDSADAKAPFGGAVVARSVAEATAFCVANQLGAIVAIGNNQVRSRVAQQFRDGGVRLARVIHPKATVAGDVGIGDGTVVFAGVCVNPGSSIGANAILNTGCTVDHDNVVGDNAHLAPGVHTGGTVRIGEGAFVGVGASIRNNVSIGAWSVVGVGAAVVSDIPEGVVAFGNPARVRQAQSRDGTIVDA